jgi:adenosylcobinamide-phosphate synthase
MNNLNILIVGFVLDLIIGDPENFPHLIRLIGNIINFYYKKIKKYNFFFSGFLIFLLSQITVIFFYFLVLYIIKDYRILMFLFNSIIIYYCLATRSLYIASTKIYFELKNNNIFEARKKLSYIVGRDTENLNEEKIINAVIETVSENTSDGIIAPLFYIALFGPVGGLIYKTTNTLDSMIGYKNKKFYKIGFVSAKADDILNFIPARLTAFIFLILSIKYEKFKQTLKVILSDHSNHLSPNSGWPESAIAGLLGIQLGGTNEYFKKKVVKPTIGEKLNKSNIEFIKLTNKIMILTSLIGFAISVLFIIMR